MFTRVAFWNETMMYASNSSSELKRVVNTAVGCPKTAETIQKGFRKRQNQVTERRRAP